MGGLIVDTQNHLITHANPAALALLLYPIEYFLGQHIADLSLWLGAEPVREWVCPVVQDKVLTMQVCDGEGKFRTIRLVKATQADCIYIHIEDISLVMRLQNELAMVKRNLDEAQRLAKLGFWERQLPSGEVLWSDEMEKIFGVKKPSTNDIMGMIVPEDIPKFQKRIDNAVVEGQVYELDYRIMHPDGSIRHLWSRVQPQLDKDGTIVKRFGTVQDITERKEIERSLREIEERHRAEHALLMSEAKLREQQAFFGAVINEAPVMIFVKDITGRYTLANQAIATHYGVSVNEMIGKTDYDLCLLEAEAAMIQAKDVEVMNSSHLRVLFEESVTPRSGETRFFQTVKAPLILPDGSRHIIGVALDITERKRAEEAIRISEARYQRLFETSKDGILLLNFDSGHVVEVNPLLLDMTGYGCDDFLGRPLWECPPFVGLWRDKEVFYANLTHATSYTQVDLLLSNQTRLTVEFSTNVYSEEQEQIVHCCIRDLTEKIRINAELARLDRLNVVGEMAASIAHEIRNPMTTVRGFLQLLGGRPELSPHQHIMQLMIQEIDRANNIITTYLSLARTSVSTVPCNLGTLVNDFAPILNADILMRDRNISYELSPTSAVSVNESEIKQLLANLVKNACESMSSGGRVKVSTSENSREVCLTVADEGEGIPDQLLPRLGTPFLTTKDNGVGLGLAICYRIAERHGAEIRVTSSPHGSQFMVCFKKP